MKFLQRLRPRVVITIAVTIAAVMILSSYIELQESKKETLHLLTQSSYALIETIQQSSINALNSSEEIEDLITNRLLDNARLIKHLDSLNVLTVEKLIQIGNENSVYRINIFDKNGNRVLSNRIPEPGHVHGEENINRFPELKSILTGESSQMIIGLKNAEFVDEQRYAVAIARYNNRGAIVVNLDANDFLEFRKKIGIGKIIKDLSDNHGIIYLVLQDSIGILAASNAVDSISSFDSDSFLVDALQNDSVFTRTTLFRDEEVFEAVKRLNYDGEIAGIFRLGLTLEEVKLIEDRMIRRLIIISIILAAISVISLSIIFTSQNLKTVSEEFGKFKTFTSSVLENMADAVVVVDTKMIVTLFNKSSEHVFEKKSSEVIGSIISTLSSQLTSELEKFISNIEDNPADLSQSFVINNKVKHLLLNFTQNLSSDNTIESYTIVIKDFTELNKMEEESKRNEKLSAMGELASGVAHEIRNPINAIGMIAQRLDKEFAVVKDDNEYHKITSLLKNEVIRINKIITQFLSYAKPIEIQISSVDTKAYFDDLIRLFSEQARQKRIQLKRLTNDSILVRIDPELMKQSLINIIQNAIDAANENSSVEISYILNQEDFEISISDTGTGISDEMKKKIFDLYFTTKKEGNGLGLSIAQKIVTQHGGTIEVTSQLNKGTTFRINIPQ